MKKIEYDSETRVNVYTIYTIQIHTYKSTERVPNKPTTTSILAIEFLKRREREPFASRTFV